MLTMKTTTALVGVGAAALAGAAIYLALRKPDEEKAASPTPTNPTTPTTHPDTHPSFDKFVDQARGHIVNGGTPGGQTTTPSPDEPTGDGSSLWNHRRGLREGRDGSHRSLHR